MEAASMLTRMSGTSSRVDEGWRPLMQALSEGPRRPRNFADDLDISHQRVYNVRETLEPAGLLEDTVDGLVLTPSGEAALTAYNTAREIIEEENIGLLARSKTRREVMSKLFEGPCWLRKICEGPNSPSKESVRRAIRAFEQREWVEKDATGQMRLADCGQTVWSVYRQLETEVRQAIQKAPFCNRLGKYYDLPPLHLLKKSDLVEPTPNNPYPSLDASLELAQARSNPVDKIRTVVFGYVPVMFEEFSNLLKWNTEFEIVFDKKTYEDLLKSAPFKYLFGSVVTPTVDAKVLDESIFYGVGLYDRGVLVGVRNDPEDPGCSITSYDDEVYSWGEELFETHWNAGTPLSKILFNELIE